MALKKWQPTENRTHNTTPQVSILPNGLFIFNKATRASFNIPDTRRFVHLYYDNEKNQVAFEFVDNTTDINPVRLHFNKTGMSFSAKQFLGVLDTKIEQTTQFSVQQYKSDGLTIYLKQPTQQTNKTFRRPVLNFQKMGIPNGAKLVYAHDTSKVARVVSEHTVEFDGKIYSLSVLTKKLRQLSYYVAPCKHWTYKGKKLSDIYDDTYPSL